jgi:hypothetical protein
MLLPFVFVIITSRRFVGNGLEGGLQGFGLEWFRVRVRFRFKGRVRVRVRFKGLVLGLGFG